MKEDCFLRGKCSPRIIDAHDTVGIGFWSIVYWSMQYALPIRAEDFATICKNQGGMIQSGDINIPQLINGFRKYP